jgi:hypothetical protein
MSDPDRLLGYDPAGDPRWPRRSAARPAWPVPNGGMSLDLADKIDDLLARDLSVPGRAEAAQRRLIRRRAQRSR